MTTVSETKLRISELIVWVCSYMGVCNIIALIFAG